MMKNLKSQKGSITLLVITSCLFFVVAVTTVGMHMQSKKVAVDREYKQIKESYEKDLAKIGEIYSGLEQFNNLKISLSNIKFDKDSRNISGNATIDTTGLDVKTIKYGWYYSENKLSENVEETLINNINNWSYLEDIKGNDEIYINRTYAQNERIGYHYLCAVANDKVIYKAIEPLKKLYYIESTGTQWIDTKWVPPIDAGIEFDIQLTETEKAQQQGEGVVFFAASYDDDEEYAFSANVGAAANLYKYVHYWVDKKLAYGGTVYRKGYGNITQRSVMSVKSGLATFQGVNFTIATRTSGNEGNMALLAKPTGTGIMDKYNVKIYSCKLYEGDTLVKELVPVLDEEGIPCLYDKIGNDYYYNQGTGQFEYPEVHQIEYIESTGTQWIDTKWAPPIDAGIELDIQLVENEKTRVAGNGSAIFSTASDEVDEDYVFGSNIGAYDYQYDRLFYWVDKKYEKGGEVYLKIYSDITQRSLLKLKSKSAIFQGIETSIATRTAGNEANLALLAKADGTNIMDRYNVRIYSCKLYEGETLVKNLVPVLDEYDTPCLYDTIGKEFYYNQGTGQFEYED